MKKINSILFVFVLILGCTNNQQYEINSSDPYEKGKFTVEQVEQKNPGKFLKVTASSKKNLIQQTVVKGKILNTAKVVAYKDVAVRLSFFSKTGALLEEDDEIVYETIQPGYSKTFKSKFFAPKGADSVAIKIQSAKY